MEKKVDKIVEYASVCSNIYIYLFLSIITVVIYSNTIGNNFIAFDDNLNVTGNPHVRSGLSIENIKWAFRFTTQGDKHYWHPLTSISHMIDCQIFGLNAAGHHFTNLILHICNTILLFRLFFKMTSGRLKSFCIALFFALHPLNVESVAWVAERKNVLSTFFWFLTMLAYLRFAAERNFYNYLFVFTGMLLGLLCKPILVTLPCVLLLIDIWPIGRIHLAESRRSTNGNNNYYERSQWFLLIIEKIPLFALSVCWTLLSSLSMERIGAVVSYKTVSIDIRIANAIMAYSKYIGKLLWPFDLSVFYPFPSQVAPFWHVISSAIFLLILSIVSLKTIKRIPWLFVGWFWYLGTLFPVIGLIQSGLWPAMADRYAYIPFIGLFVIVVWGISQMMPRRVGEKKGAVLLLIFVYSLLLGVISYHQVGLWEDNEKLFKQAIRVDNQNWAAHNNLGAAYMEMGLVRRALQHFKVALQLNPSYPPSFVRVGAVLSKLGDYEKAKSYLLEAIRLYPDYTETYKGMGNICYKQKKLKDSARYYEKSLQLNPHDAEAHYNLAVVFENQDNLLDAALHYTIAIRLDPNRADAHNNLGVLFGRKGNYQKSIYHFQKALQLKPGSVEARKNLTTMMAAKAKADRERSNKNK